MISTRDATRPVSVADGALRPGRRVFSRYLLHRVVGRGGMGVVWLAGDEKLERQVALKFLPDMFFLDAAARDDLKRETRRSLDLTHPHIVRIHDFVEDEEMAAIAMEFVDGPTLSQLRVEQSCRHFEPDSLSVWTSALCAALHYAHDAGRCVHRDLKPGNLMVNSRGVLKVADFGISCSLHNTAARVSAWSSTGGTLGYMSPQQLLGELAAPSDDIYSVGATLYELLTGTLPFFAGDLALQIREIVPETATARRRKMGLASPPVAKVWEETIAACLAKRPADRPSCAGEIARRLGLVGVPLSEPMAAPGDALSPTARSAPTIVVRLPRWRRTLDRVLKRHVRLKISWWLIVTACALGAASVAWMMGHRPVPLPALASESIDAKRDILPVEPLPANTVSPGAAPSSPISAGTNSDRLALLSPIPPATAAQGAATPAGPAQVQLLSIPPGIPFKVLANAYESAITEVLRTGETPAVLDDLPAGAYRVVFAPPSAASRAASIQVPTAGTAVFQQEFPHAVLKLRSQPDGAEILCDGRAIGSTPLELPVLPGRHEIKARWSGHEARSRIVNVADAAEQTVSFDFQTSAATGKGRPHHSRKTEDDSILTKVSRSVKTFFTGDAGKKR